MAIVIRGKSLCHLCGLIIASGDQVQCFPPALFDITSTAAHLNDSGVHLACFEGLPEYDEAVAGLAAHARRVEGLDDLHR